MNPKAMFSRMFNLRALRHYVYYRHIYERPQRGFKDKVAKSVSRPDFQEIAQSLETHGFVVLPSYFSGETLKTMQDDYERWASKGTPDENGYLGFDASHLPDSVPFSQAAIDPFLTALVEHYWGKPVFLAGADGYRLEPMEKEDYESWMWHHDSKRKQVKIMILLTDVPDDGQRMDYLSGTHKMWHKNVKSYGDTRFTPEEVQNYGETLPCSGPAGSVLIFDTNGLHRGNRNLGPRRDVWIFAYRAAGRPLGPVTASFHPDVVQTMTPENRRMTRITTAA